ncbi:MAG: signal peptidase I [bacterium]
MHKMPVDWVEITFWSLFFLLTVGEILVAYVYKLPKTNVVRDWIEPAFEAIIIATIIRTLFIQAFRIPSSSMEDTLLIGDQIMANKFIYGTHIPIKDKLYLRFTQPKRGEVFIFRYPEEPRVMFIKRCIGLPGDKIEVKNKVLFINDKKVEEAYVYHKDMRVFPNYITVRDNFGPVIVPADNYFAMGDNRDNSADSRFWGFLPSKFLRGKAWIVYWPPDRWKVIKHFNINADAKTNTTNIAVAVPAK